MNLGSFIYGNLLRRPARTLLTISAISLGIAAVVSLTSISWGFEQSWQKANDARGTDLIVTRMASENTLPSTFPAEEPRRLLLTLPHVREVVGLFSTLLSVSDTAPPVFVFGWEFHSYLWDHLKLAEGRWPERDNEPVAMIGSTASAVLGKKVGDEVSIEGHRIRVIGIFESSAMVENGALLLTLTQAQSATEKSGKVSVLNIKLDAGATEADSVSLRNAVREKLPGFSAITSGELVRSNAIVALSKAMSGATTLIAGLVSALIVFNTMLMSISERTKEIGVLMALGWNRQAILKLVCAESALLAGAGGIVGILLGTGMAGFISRMDLVRGKIEPIISLPFLVLVLVFSTVLGVLGGVYPARKAANLSPAQALRQE